MKNNTALPYCHKVETKIREGIRNGLSMNVILDGMQHLQNAPRAMKTLYNKYGEVIGDERANLHSYLGQKARERIDAGSDRILELALRSKAGWNPTVRVEETDPDEADENKDAISVLAALLKKDQ